MNRTFFKFATSASAVAISAIMSVTPVFAADYIKIDGNGYSTPGVSAEDGTWNWKDADNLALNNYNGSNIYADGNLNIQVSGNNTITSERGATILIDDGDLTITGDGTLTACQDPDISSIAVFGDNKVSDIYIEGITLKTGEEGAGAFVRATNGDITIKDATFEGKATYYMGLAENGDITIDNVNINATAGETVFFSKFSRCKY